MRTAALLLAMGVGMQASAQTGQRGLLVMAHGGSEEWNGEVYEAVDRLRDEMPIAVAFGMANPVTMHAAVDSLLGLEVSQITVVRLFLSGDSFMEETGFVLGLHGRRPEGGMHAEHMHQITVPVPVRVAPEGLLDAPEVGGILRKRALALSGDPQAESVLLIAHGAASEEENDSWLARMDRLADSVRTEPFADVRVETLREDWEEPRAEAERRIRAYVASETEAGREVLVIPFRVSGFGPYAEVLDGLEYRSDGVGLLPHPLVEEWVRRQAAGQDRPGGAQVGQ